MTSILKALNISQIKVSPYHPQANGMIERLNGTLKKAIKKAGATKTTWDKWLHFVLHAIRITDHASTGHTPYKLLFGRKPNSPISSLRDALEGITDDVPQPVTDYLSSLHSTMANAKQAAERAEAKAKLASKLYHRQQKKSKDFYSRAWNFCLVLQALQTERSYSSLAGTIHHPQTSW